jgi:hypothetical protein
VIADAKVGLNVPELNDKAFKLALAERTMTRPEKSLQFN